MLRLSWVAYNVYVVTLNYRITAQFGFIVGIAARYWVDSLYFDVVESFS